MNVRNGERFLRTALDSILAQTFRDWELIVWDDCSTDDSAGIVHSYRDERVRYLLSPEDTPLGPARNAAISQARGEWVAFLDQDDLWLPHKLASQIQLADSDSTGRCGIVYGRTVVFYPDGREHDFDSHHEFRRLPEGNLYKDLFRKSCFIAISSVLLRRSALERVGEIPLEFELISDFYLFTSISRYYDSRAVQGVVCRYRRHANSLSQVSRRRMHEEALLLMQNYTGGLEAKVERQARKSFQTIIAITELFEMRSAARGLVRLLRYGSPWYVLTRPCVRLMRQVRRRFGRPRIRYPDVQTVSRESALAPVEATAIEYPLTLSIIVVNWKVRELLRECLSSVYDQMRMPSESWELIVVDNDSRDGSAEMVRREFPKATLLANRENAGFSKANNQALPLCRGRFLLLLNPDVVILNSGVDRMLEILKTHSDTAVLGCRLLNSDHSLQKWTAGEPPRFLNIACHFLFLYRLLPPAILPRPLFLEAEPKLDAQVGWVSGACMMIRREALGQTIFDERFFMYCEDLYFCQILVEAGWKVVYTPRVQVVHHGGRSTENQTIEIQFSKMSNLRKVFVVRNGVASVFYFDVFMALGFLLRLIGFGVATVASPGRGYDLRAAKSRQFFTESVRLFGSR